MANRNESSRKRQNRRLLPLVAASLLLGTLLAWWGVRDGRHLFGEPVRKPIAVAAPDVPQNVQNTSAMVARGAEIEQQDCAGCHELDARSTGPSYQEIVKLYRRQSAPSGSNQDLLSKLATAIEHPQPGWTNFTSGPPELGLGDEDRAALASWMLNKFGTGKTSGKD